MSLDLQAQSKILALQASAKLSPEAYYVFSQIREGILFKDLLVLLPWDSNEVKSRLEELYQKGSIQIQNPESKEGFLDSETEALLKDEEKDPQLQKLDRSFRRELRRRIQFPPDANPYEILGIPLSSSSQEIRNQYLEISRRFHPDRFFNKHLGPYQEILNSVFARIQKAYACLKNPIEREALNRTLALQNPSSKTGPKRNLKLDPELERLGKAETAFKKGLELASQFDFLGAEVSIQEAIRLAPKREVYKDELRKLEPQLKRAKAKKQFLETKKQYELVGAEYRFSKILEDVIQSDPDLIEAHLLLARLYMELRRDDKTRDCREMLLRAKAQMKQSADPAFLLAKLYFAAGDFKSAKKEVEEALARDPKHGPSKKLLEQLK